MLNCRFIVDRNCTMLQFVELLARSPIWLKYNLHVLCFSSWLNWKLVKKFECFKTGLLKKRNLYQRRAEDLCVIWTPQQPEYCLICFTHGTKWSSRCWYKADVRRKIQKGPEKYWILKKLRSFNYALVHYHVVFFRAVVRQHHFKCSKCLYM